MTPAEPAERSIVPVELAETTPESATPPAASLAARVTVPPAEVPKLGDDTEMAMGEAALLVSVMFAAETVLVDVSASSW